MKGVTSVEVVKGGYRAFVNKQSKKMNLYMTMRENSWNPFEDLRKNLITGSTEVQLYDAQFNNVIAVEKSSGGYIYWYWDVRINLLNLIDN